MGAAYTLSISWETPGTRARALSPTPALSGNPAFTGLMTHRRSQPGIHRASLRVPARAILCSTRATLSPPARPSRTPKYRTRWGGLLVLTVRPDPGPGYPRVSEGIRGCPAGWEMPHLYPLRPNQARGQAPPRSTETFSPHGPPGYTTLAMPITRRGVAEPPRTHLTYMLYPNGWVSQHVGA